PRRGETRMSNRITFDVSSPTSVNVAEALRAMAREYETTGQCNGGLYSCYAVRDTFGREIGSRYADTFGIRTFHPECNDLKLWLMSDAEQRDMRVLMLCFAAAMAETGDL